MRLNRVNCHGAAALAVSMILLFATSVGVLYLNRGLIFEQKASANQLRSSTAQEIAEAGLEWAVGMLNAPYDINSACQLQSSATNPFRRIYTQPNWPTSSDMAPVTNTYPGCKINNGTLSCNCPNVATGGSTATASLGTTVLPGFTIAFQAVPTDPSDADCSPNPAHADCPKDVEAVRVIATGCTATADACGPGKNTSSTGPDAVATVSAVIKLRPLLRAAPPAALTCGRNCAPGGSYNIINTDPSTNGITINAGGTITTGAGTTVATMPGLPAANSQVAADSSLSALSSSDANCSNSAMFKTYFGTTLAEYADSPSTKVIPGCGQANTCGSLVDAAYAEGWRNFYFPDGFARNSSSGSLGSAGDPVTLVTPGSFDVNGNISIYGMIFSNSSNVNDLGTGTADIFGGIVVCKDHSSNGNGTIAYDPNVLLGARRNNSIAVKLPGTWTDRCRLSSANPPVLSCS